VTLEFPEGMLPAFIPGRGMGMDMRLDLRMQESPQRAEIIKRMLLRYGQGPGEGKGQAEQGEKPKVEILEPASGRPSVTIDRLEGHQTKTVTFKIRLNEIKGTKATIRYSSTRGGVATREIFIGSEN